MNLVYGISRWTNSSRPGARHIDNGQGKPLCGGNGRKAFTWEREIGAPTCQRCIKISQEILNPDNSEKPSPKKAVKTPTDYWDTEKQKHPLNNLARMLLHSEIR